MPDPIAIVAGIAATLGLGLLIGRRNAGWLPALSAAAVPGLGAVVLAIWWIDLAIEPVMAPWDGVRLAPSMAIRLGWSIYPTADRGPVLGWIYGPIAALFYVPATVAGEPWAMILAGRCLSLIGFFGPVAWILTREVRRGRGSLTTAALLFAGFAILADASPALRYASTAILADNPAIGLGAIALGLLSGPEGGPSRKELAWAMTAATLAAWSKQLAMPIVILVGLAALRFQGGKALVRIALIPLAVSAVLLAIFGWRELVLNLVVIPSRHPWHTTGFAGIGPSLLRAYRPDAWILIAMVVGWLLGDRRGRSWRSVGSPFLIGSMLALPLASAGFLKVGGDVNSLAHAIYPASIAAVLAIGGAVQRRPGLGWGLLVIVGLLAWGRFDDCSDRLTRATWSWRDESRQVAATLRAEPGSTYFPCHPLEHLAVDRRPYHQEYGLFDRDLAGLPLSPEHLRDGIPAGTRRLVYPAGRTYSGFFLLRVLPEFRVETHDPAFPGARVFDRDQAPDSSNVTVRSPSTT